VSNTQAANEFLLVKMPEKDNEGLFEIKTKKFGGVCI
jgi:hypothetical protein